MQIRDNDGDPSPTALAASGTLVVVVAAGGAAAAANGSTWIAPIIGLIGAVFVALSSRRHNEPAPDQAA
jgi:hypothetical protein